MSKHVYGQLVEIRQKNRILLKKYGKSLDFLGSKGNFAGIASLFNGKIENITISNLMVLRGKVKIVDLDLLDLRFGKDSWNPIHVIGDNLSYLFSTFFLGRIFKLKI